jgi:hypothetical protein
VVGFDPLGSSPLQRSEPVTTVKARFLTTSPLQVPSPSAVPTGEWRSNTQPPNLDQNPAPNDNSTSKRQHTFPRHPPTPRHTALQRALIRPVGHLLPFAAQTGEGRSTNPWANPSAARRFYMQMTAHFCLVLTPSTIARSQKTQQYQYVKKSPTTNPCNFNLSTAHRAKPNSIANPQPFQTHNFPPHFEHSENPAISIPYETHLTA